LAWLNQQNSELRQWLDEHPETEIDPDTIVVPADQLSAQLLEETTRDEAISDTLYELGRAFHDMAGDSDAETQTRGLTAYLKEVQRLSKQQFRSKALQSKIKVSAPPRRLKQDPLTWEYVLPVISCPYICPLCDCRYICLCVTDRPTEISDLVGRGELVVSAPLAFATQICPSRLCPANRSDRPDRSVANFSCV